MIKKSAKAAGAAALTVATVAATTAVHVATEGVTPIYSLQTKKKNSSDSDGIIENGRHVHFPVYEITPLIRLGKRWYDPFTLKQKFLKDHRIPKRLRYVDIRLKKTVKKKKTKKRLTKSKNFIKERKDHDISVASSVRDKRSSKAKRAFITEEPQDGPRTVVSRKTTEFADGSIKKEVFFNGTIVKLHVLTLCSIPKF